MHFLQLHPSAACSSVILRNIWHNSSWAWFVNGKSKDERFIDEFALHFFKESVIFGYRPTELSFVVASTLNHQSKARRILKEKLGFIQLSKNYNKKNRTKPFLSVGRCEDIYNRLLDLGYDPATGKRTNEGVQ